MRISSVVRDGRLELRVHDNGPGISDEVMGHIFEPLFSTRSFGIGLGLPLVKQVAEEHGGGIELRSSPGTGTLATFWLPA